MESLDDIEIQFTEEVGYLKRALNLIDPFHEARGKRKRRAMMETMKIYRSEALGERLGLPGKIVQPSYVFKDSRAAIYVPGTLEGRVPLSQLNLARSFFKNYRRES